ncbi:MAG: hypothetical protein IPO08_22810 [Xanthomonadales bacterium]|nr:hypothetical protein [Xanthomonadales bacterium]
MEDDDEIVYGYNIPATDQRLLVRSGFGLNGRPLARGFSLVLWQSSDELSLTRPRTISHTVQHYDRRLRRQMLNWIIDAWAELPPDVHVGLMQPFVVETNQAVLPYQQLKAQQKQAIEAEAADLLAQEQARTPVPSSAQLVNALFANVRGGAVASDPDAEMAACEPDIMSDDEPILRRTPTPEQEAFLDSANQSAWPRPPQGRSGRR